MDCFATLLWMQMQAAGCKCRTTFHKEALGQADACVSVSVVSKRIASLGRARVSVIMSELDHSTFLLMTYCNTLIPSGNKRRSCGAARNPTLMCRQKRLTYERQTHVMHLRR